MAAACERESMGTALWCGSLWSWACVMYQVGFSLCGGQGNVEECKKIRKVGVQIKKILSENVRTNIQSWILSSLPNAHNHLSFYEVIYIKNYILTLSIFLEHN